MYLTIIFWYGDKTHSISEHIVYNRKRNNATVIPSKLKLHLSKHSSPSCKDASWLLLFLLVVETKQRMFMTARVCVLEKVQKLIIR